MIMEIISKAKAEKDGDKPKMSQGELLYKARIGAAQKILQAIKDDDADMLAFALHDFDCVMDQSEGEAE